MPTTQVLARATASHQTSEVSGVLRHNQPILTYDIGFLGGGQLARMSIMAAQRMGLTCISLDPGEDTPASQIAPSVVGKLDDPHAVAKIMQSARGVTLENEFIWAHVIEEGLRIAGRTSDCILPGTETLAVIQDKFLQRKRYHERGVASPVAVEVDEAVATFGFPFVLKSRFGGYDGKGTRYARSKEEFESHRPLFAQGGWFAEAFVPFKRELAVMVCRSRTQELTFPTMETQQVNHVCDLVFPTDCDASQVALDAVRAVDGYGLFGVELFECHDGSIQVNEIAPRPHNSGHYTLDWGGMSQFEAHVRLVAGLELPPIVGQPTAMVNLLGQEGAKDFRDAIRKTLAEIPQAKVHWYGKAEAKPGRKMGHINVTGEGAAEIAKKAQALFYSAWVE